MSMIITFFIVILVIALIILLSKYIINKTFFFIELISNYLFRKYKLIVSTGYNPNKKYIKFLKVSEIIFIILTFIFLITTLMWIIKFNTSKYLYIFLISAAIVIFYTIFIGNFNLNIKKQLDKSSYKYVSPIETLIKKIDKESYIYTRMKVLVESLLSFYIHLLIVFILYSFSSLFTDIPNTIRYVFWMSLPLGLASWVYFSTFNSAKQDVRRIMIYIILLIITINKSYEDFKILLNLEGQNKSIDYFSFLILTVFTALDRLLKSVKDDYKNFKDPKKSCKCNKAT
ncbi:hypothetical protein NRS6141_02514 [Bacillus subtilis]|nr:hypothetical protein ETA19_20670 [Bacillus subtilis]QAW22807.1 hypothetical protein ETA18_20670 [Bacillus subtilis]CAF1829927.1 hypothetical protein NRS6141_02514 [Bacillus subtilis]CAF1899089.1 hypothetical protein NRS6204_02217 [Bacillus subtilis]CAF1904857.1 hypothetical protein NRS6205_02531 [Bacillus subtilis]